MANVTIWSDFKTSVTSRFHKNCHFGHLGVTKTSCDIGKVNFQKRKVSTKSDLVRAGKCSKNRHHTR